MKHVVSMKNIDVYDEKVAYRIKDAARLLGVGRGTLFKLMKEGRLRRSRIGGVVVITRAEIERLVAEGTDHG